MITEDELNKILADSGKTDDQIVKELSYLMKAREEISNFSYSFNPDFYQGSLVYNYRNSEVGFVVGPLDVWGKEIFGHDIMQKMSKNYDSVKSRTYLIVSMGENYENVDPSKPSLGSSLYRIRYVSGKHLQPLKIEKSRNYISDIETFCNNQCIMECSDTCVWYKYRKKVTK